MMHISSVCFFEKENFSFAVEALFFKPYFSSRKQSNEKNIIAIKMLNFVIKMPSAPKISISTFEKKMLKPTEKTISSSFVKKPNFALSILVKK